MVSGLFLLQKYEIRCLFAIIDGRSFSYDQFGNISKTGSLTWACPPCYNGNNQYNSVLSLSCFLNNCTDGISRGSLSLMGAQSFPLISKQQVMSAQGVGRRKR